ncbi:MAG TPA: hypothetical protein PLP30_05785 [Clostridia bacterium]|jgi:hypothetical protein|nr:hypothetical protein [Clostridia bacterium]HRX41139.1 hypothetical protein [Clostridia bacterium]
MNDRGTLAAETAVVFPLFLLLLVVLILALARTITYEKPEKKELTDIIYFIDSVKRKVSMLDEILE